MTTFGYESGDPRYRLETITHKLGTATLATFGYTRDDVGNPLSFTGLEGAWAYTYDAMNRLATALPPEDVPLPAQAGGTYSYDWVGNMKAAATSNPWQYNAADQLTVWPGMHSYSYHDDGALMAVKTADGSATQQSFTYHPTGLMNTALFSNQTQTLTNLWDADEHRVGFSVGEDEYTAVFDVTAGIPAVIAEKQPDNSYVYYIREPGGELICRVATVGETTHTWFYHFDELGSTRLITDYASPAVVTDRYTYDAYGTMIAHDRNAGSIDQPYQYVGQLGYYKHYQAPEFGRLQLGVRFYDPEAGRFERRDPVPTYGTAAQAYVRGSPVVVPDPSGLYPRFNCPRRTAGALAIEAATRRVCDALSTGAIDGCIGCTTGPRQLQCLKDFCSRGVVQCGSWECVHGWPARPPGRPRPIAPPCGFTYGSIGGQQRPGETVVICGTALGGRCPGGAAATLLHEMMHVCGSRNETAAENKMARCFRQLGWRL